MYYIQRKDGKYLETVSECARFKDARFERNEYQISDTSAIYYISQRACKQWREDSKQTEA